MEKEKAPQREQDKRLTIRLPNELDNKLRNEAIKKGTSINQIMVYMLNKYFD